MVSILAERTIPLKRLFKIFLRMHLAGRFCTYQMRDSALSTFGFDELKHVPFGLSFNLCRNDNISNANRSLFIFNLETNKQNTKDMWIQNITSSHLWYRRFRVVLKG